MATDEAIRIARIVLDRAAIAEVVLALGHNGLLETSLANRTQTREATIVLTVALTTNFVIALSVVTVTAVTSILSSIAFPDELELFLFEGLLVFRVELMTAFIVASVVDKDAGVAKAAITVFIVVFAALWVMIYSSGHFYECWCFLWTLQCSGELFLPEVVFSLNEVVGIPVLASIDFVVKLTFANLS